MSPVSPTLAGVFFTTELPGKPPLQYFYLENPTDRGAWRATVYGLTESDTTEATKHKAINNTVIVSGEQ